MFRVNDTQLAFGELTFTSMRCDQKLSPTLVDTALGVADAVPGFTSQLLGKLITHVVCRVAPPYTWAPQPGCLQQCDDGCRPRSLKRSESIEQKARIVKSDVAALMELAELIKLTMNETRDPRREKAEYFVRSRHTHPRV